MRSAPRISTLILLTGLSTVSLNMFVPALPAIAAELGISYATASLSIAAIWVAASGSESAPHA